MTKDGKPPDRPGPHYKATHGSDGYPLGSERWPNTREGKRAMRRSWRGKG